MVSALRPGAAVPRCDRLHPFTALSNPVFTDNQAALPIFNPAGYQGEEAARRPYPLLLLNDGQNLFFDQE